MVIVQMFLEQILIQLRLDVISVYCDLYGDTAWILVYKEDISKVVWSTGRNCFILVIRNEV